jgi:exopolyphosphatase/guanosine-5'-triphosphate,3'-diphosphate pyrophosphatase
VVREASDPEVGRLDVTVPRTKGKRGDGSPTSDLVAIVDLGSTAVRFLLAQIRPRSGFRVLAQDRVPTRLGGGAPGTLPRRAIDQTLRAVHRFFARHSPQGQGPRIVAIATSAVRDARNRERLLDPLRRNEGIEVQVLSGRDEARFGVVAALESLPFAKGVVVDLGGASLQLSRVRHRRVVSSASLPLGAVRTTRLYLRRDPPTPRELRALRTDIRTLLQDALPPADRGEMLIGLGGTVRTLGSIHLRANPGERKHRHGLVLNQSDVTAIRERLESLSSRGRRRIRGLKAERADIILAGAMVIEDVMISGGYLSLMISTRGVRDGVLLHEASRSRAALSPR